jgi:regulator of extracellular matrix RemA (YlzA/DUF370 family)
MLIVIIWGVIVTICVVVSEYYNWKRMNEQDKKISKLTKCKYGRERRGTETGTGETQETGTTKGT